MAGLGHVPGANNADLDLVHHLFLELKRLARDDAWRPDGDGIITSRAGV